MDPQNQCCSIRPGYKHSILGEIGGWEVAVIRSFRVEGILYFDTELTAKTILSLPEEVKTNFFSYKYIFTRIRIAQKDTSPSNLLEESTHRLKVIKHLQKQWYDQIGKEEVDPTQVSSDSEYDGEYDDGRRQVMKALAVVGIAALIFMLSECEDCKNNGSHGSWGRSGGGYSM